MVLNWCNPKRSTACPLIARTTSPGASTCPVARMCCAVYMAILVHDL